MPSLPKRPCSHAGCTAYAMPGQSLCTEHERARKREVDTRRSPEVRELYHTSAWRELRAWHIRKQPLCQECMRHGRVVEARVVDHITPHKGDRRLFFDPGNLQSLCKSCHDRKTAMEDGGFGNSGRSRRAWR